MKKNATLSCLLFCILTSTFSYAQWIRKADAQRRRSETTSVVYNDKLYTFLGFADSSLNGEPSSEVYDPATNTWTLLRSLPVDKMVTHQGVALVDGTVWHIGGRLQDNLGPLTSETWIYNIASDTWSAGPQLLNPATGQPLLWGGGGAALLGRTLHLFGGFTINTCNNDQTAYHLTLDVDAWLANPSQPAPWKNERAPLPVKRNHFGTAVLGGKIYALGGQFGHDCGGGQDQRYAHVYNPATDNWTQLPMLPSARSHIEGSIFAMDGKIYILAGQSTDGINTNKVTIFDPAGNGGAGSWSGNTSLTLPSSYEGLSSKAIGNTIFISHGGEGSSRKTRNTTYARTIARTLVYKFGFQSGCATFNMQADDVAKTKTLLFTIDGSKTYAVSSNASWLTVSKNATGTAVPNGVDIELIANTAGLASGTYNATITATGTGSGTTYTPATYCVTLTVQQGAPEVGTTPEVILSGVKGTVSAAKPVVISNTGTGALQISALTIAGTHAAAFRLQNPPALPFAVPAGQSVTLGIQFAPSASQTGALSAALRIATNDADEATTSVGLYGLSAIGEQGDKEPPLDGIVKTVGYNINVGGTSLILSTGPAAIGDEVLAPLFRKAGAGPVTMKAVARYSPDDLLPFGYYINNNGTPALTRVGTVALKGEQTLYPALTADSKTEFDPGSSATFGFYTGATSYASQNTYTEDALNAAGPLDHAVRIYPLKNRAGVPVANSYLICFEPASNGDYQDYVFEVTNITPATVSSAVIRINTGGPAVNVNGVAWLGCATDGSCNGFVSGGGYAYAQSPPPAIAGIMPPMAEAIMQTEWTGGETGGTPVGVGQVAFAYTIPVANGDYTVRLHFAELNKNGAGLRKFDVDIEGGAKELTGFDIFAEAGGMNKAIYRDFPVGITDGNIKIEFYRQVQNAKISAIEILKPDAAASQSGTLQAEAAVLYRAVASSKHSGYTGAGFADYVNNADDYIEWTVAKAGAGTASFQFRYANGATTGRALQLEVNGVVVSSSLAFPATGAWTNWSVVTATANLVAGSNRIRLTAIGASGPNIDYLQWSSGSTAAQTAASMVRSEEARPTALKVAVSPNPVSASAFIHLQTISNLPIDVSVMDMSGKVHKKFSRSMTGLHRVPVSVDGLPAGLYLILVKQGTETATARFVVERK